MKRLFLVSIMTFSSHMAQSQQLDSGIPRDPAAPGVAVDGGRPVTMPSEEQGAETLSADANGGYTFQEPQLLVQQLEQSGLAFPALAGAPGWVSPLIEQDRRFRAGALRLGKPIVVASSVEFNVEEGSTELSVESIAWLGNAVVVPLLVADGSVGGLARLPLFRNTSVSVDTTEVVLFSNPVARLVSEEEALQRSGLDPGRRVLLSTKETVDMGSPAASKGVPPKVIAMAVGANAATFSPFDIRWVVLTGPTEGERIGFVALGLPPYHTSQGVLMSADGPEVSYATSLPRISLGAALDVQRAFTPANPPAFSVR